MFKVTLSEFGNVADFEAKKRMKEHPTDEKFIKISEDKTEFVNPREPETRIVKEEEDHKK